MAEQITEIDMDKYLIIKKGDLRKLPEELQKQQSLINTAIRFNRVAEGKKEWPEHLVLNMDDEIDLWYLKENLDDLWSSDVNTVKDVAVVIVNTILQSQEL